MSEHDVLHTRICDMLGIEYPILSAGMGFVARAELAAAVSNAGGLGVLGGAGFTPEQLRAEIQKTRELTDKPFGVDLLLPAPGQATRKTSSLPKNLPKDLPRSFSMAEPLSETGSGESPTAWEEDTPARHSTAEQADGAQKKQAAPVVDPSKFQNAIQDLQGEFAVGKDGKMVQAEDLMAIVLEEAPPVFASGLGNPGPWVSELHDRGVKVLSLVGNVKNARRVADAGVDAVIAQGTEAGGHTGRVGLVSLLPAVLDAVGPTPVIAAGGICDGRGIATSLWLGAEAAWIGTRFVASNEAYAHVNYKQKITEAEEDSTVITRSYSGKTLRVIRNSWTREWEKRQDEILPFPLQFANSGSVYVVARRDGDTERGSMPCGQGAFAIKEVRPAGELVQMLVAETRETLARNADLR